MKGVVVGAVLMAGCFVSPVLHFGDGKTRQQAQHETYERVTPASFADPHAWVGAVTTAKIRVWADDAYRAQNVHWQQAFQDQLEHVNDVLAGMFGVRLVAELRAWPRHAPGASLDETLDALSQDDAGDDVLSVVGLTSSIGLAAATFDQLGVARLGGHHLVIRGYADLEERQAFEAAFTELRSDERDVLYQARRRHKTTAVLLHELGHNLGADHAPDSDTLMYPQYSERASAFDPQSRAVILASLDARLHRRAADPPGPGVAVAAAPRHARLFVRVDDAGQRFVGGQPVDPATLDELLALSHRDDPDTELVVQTTRHAPQAAIVELLDHAKAAGLARYSFAAP
ncbi:MAG TPA: matrixin family metalloprotease [Kofleriaceae bacterium]|nr:matrixin family metalloprotease [Kofleriaceae bacterium]